MNRRKLVFAILIGLSQGFCLFSATSPDRIYLSLTKDVNGQPSINGLEIYSNVTVYDMGEYGTHITIQPAPDAEHYLFAILFGSIFAGWVYRAGFSRKDSPRVKSQFAPIPPEEVKSHPLYEAFLAEDSDRTFFSGDELASVFSNWLKYRAEKETSIASTPDASKNDPEN